MTAITKNTVLLTEAIDSHIDVDRWNKLITVEDLERQTMRQMLATLGKTETESSFGSDGGGE